MYAARVHPVYTLYRVSCIVTDNMPRGAQGGTVLCTPYTACTQCPHGRQTDLFSDLDLSKDERCQSPPQFISDCVSLPLRSFTQIIPNCPMKIQIMQNAFQNTQYQNSPRIVNTHTFRSSPIKHQHQLQYDKALTTPPPTSSAYMPSTLKTYNTAHNAHP